MLFAYLAAHRSRPSTRAELSQALWPEDSTPRAADTALSALLTKLRAVLGAETIAGRQELRLVLAPNAWIDLDAAGEALHRAESAVALKDWTRAWGPARVALHVAARPFLTGYDAPWIAEIRRRLEETLLRARECVAAGGLGLGGPELGASERSARALIEVAPYRESGYRFLMETLALRGNVAEALIAYEALRQLLRQDLGAIPSPATQALHRRLLQAPPEGCSGVGTAG